MERTYPLRPIVGVGAVIFDRMRRVVLVRRAHEPLKGQWSLPGGALELGEPLETAVRREVLEETGLDVSVVRVVDVVDHIAPDEWGRVRHHFVIVDYLCRIESGVLAAGGDADAAEMAALDDLGRYRLTDRARVVIDQAVAMNGQF